MTETKQNNGIPSVVLNAVNSLTKAGVPMHSLLVSKGSELIAEVYWKPYERETLHRMYSCTKSFVSLAIGVLVGQGKISLDDPIVKYFPEMLSPTTPEEIKSMTIRNMLMMRTCFKSTTYKNGGKGNYIPSWQKDWVKSFFTTKPDHDPGMFFLYDTSSPHVMAALVEKLSGKDFVSFIKETYLSDLGVSDNTYITKDPMNYPVGGSGLMLRPIDILKTMDGVMHRSLKDVPASYLEEATSKLSETSIVECNENQKLGYGYQFWQMKDNTYGMLGLGGQYAIAFPDKDIVIVTTADTQADKSMDMAIFDSIWNITNNLDDKIVPVPSDLKIPVSRGRRSIEMEKKLNGKSFIFDEGNSIGLEKVSFSFNDDHGIVFIKQKSGEYEFKFGYGCNIVNPFPILQSSPCNVSGGFISDGSFALLVQFGHEEFGSFTMQAGFTDDSMSVIMHLYGELSIDGFDGIAKGHLT